MSRRHMGANNVGGADVAADEPVAMSNSGTVGKENTHVSSHSGGNIHPTSPPPTTSAGAPQGSTAPGRLVKSRASAPQKPSGLSSMMTRTIAGLVMLSAVGILLWAGHLAVCAMIVGLQVAVFRELVSLRYVRAKEAGMPLFRTLQWWWFVTAMLYAYGSSWLQAPMGGSAALKWLHEELPTYVTNEKFALDAVAFAMYAAVFVATVLTLRPGLYDYQLTQLSWTILSVVLVVGQLKTVIFSVYQGLFWLLFPASLVIANDTFAYFAGKTLGGRLTTRRFMALSPNKTWEGFGGALVLTMMYALYAPAVWARWAWVRCTFSELQVADVAALNPLGSCRHDYLYFTAPGGLAKIQWIALGLALFASLVAPFGGFLASAIKRAFKIKDFAGIIPGHGGFTDRMDCQLIMSLAAWVVFTTFVADPWAVLSLDQLIAAAKALSPTEQLKLVQALGQCPN